MPAYQYTGADDRYYPSLGLEAIPGLVVEFDPPPADGGPEGGRLVPQDGRWEPTKKKPSPPAGTDTDAASAADSKGGE